LEGDIEVNKKDEVIEVNKIIMKKVSEILKLYILPSSDLRAKSKWSGWSVI
jgi:hypothetical protein